MTLKNNSLIKETWKEHAKICDFILKNLQAQPSKIFTETNVEELVLEAFPQQNRGFVLRCLLNLVEMNRICQQGNLFCFLISS